MKASTAVTLAVAAVSLSACSQESVAERPAVGPAATVIGSAESCIPINQISSSKIRDDYTIDFMGPGGKVWRNTLPNRCGGLRSADAFTYSTSLSQLCNTEIVYVLERVGGTPTRGAGCGLGQFVPVRLER